MVSLLQGIQSSLSLGEVLASFQGSTITVRDPRTSTTKTLLPFRLAERTTHERVNAEHRNQIWCYPGCDDALCVAFGLNDAYVLVVACNGLDDIPATTSAIAGR